MDASERLKRLATSCAASLDCPGATQVVAGEGNPHAAIVLVGEAPGEREDREGRPFVGPAGHLLDQLLEEVALTRQEVWITNVVKCRPILFEGDRMRNRPPKASEVRAWLGCLRDELQLVDPVLLVGLGAVAGRALLGPEFSLTRDHGRWLRDRVLGADTLVTWHPAYLLRQKGSAYQKHLREALADMRSVSERLRALEPQRTLTPP